MFSRMTKSNIQCATELNMYGMRIKQINLNSARGHYLLYKSTED